jgi:hypothetical protein
MMEKKPKTDVGYQNLNVLGEDPTIMNRVVDGRLINYQLEKDVFKDFVV